MQLESGAGRDDEGCALGDRFDGFSAIAREPDFTRTGGDVPGFLDSFVADGFAGLSGGQAEMGEAAALADGEDAHCETVGGEDVSISGHGFDDGQHGCLRRLFAQLDWTRNYHLKARAMLG